MATNFEFYSDNMKYATLEKKEISMHVCEKGVRYRARIDVVYDKEDAVWKQ